MSNFERRFKTSDTLHETLEGVLARRRVPFKSIIDEEQRYILTDLDASDFHRCVVRARVEKEEEDKGLTNCRHPLVAFSEEFDKVVEYEFLLQGRLPFYQIVDEWDVFYKSWDLPRKKRKYRRAKIKHPDPLFNFTEEEIERIQPTIKIEDLDEEDRAFIEEEIRKSQVETKIEES